MFTRIVLRTTDPEAAGAFYDAVIGGRGDGIVELPAASAAKGAVPHWLGHLGVADVEATLAKWVARGATVLGAPGERPILRGDGSAVVALEKSSTPSRAGVVWHVLNSANADTSVETYTTLFGWSIVERVDLGPGVGTFQVFSFQPGAQPSGVIGDIAGRPDVHPQWLHFFAVPSLEKAIELTLAHGGKVIGPTNLPNGALVAACDDPQGAAFGLWQAP